RSAHFGSPEPLTPGCCLLGALPPLSLRQQGRGGHPLDWMKWLATSLTRSRYHGASIKRGQSRRKRRKPAMEHIAIDLGAKESQMCVRSGEGEIVDERRMATRPGKLRRYLAGRPKSRVILETG